ncbi:MAG: CHAD domain-containing protein [Candidatus Marinimicrobia bacterium]|nr:CHAD domain-containing protein [Candidatus Neomarinimicrobiota bacterium]
MSSTITNLNRTLTSGIIVRAQKVLICLDAAQNDPSPLATHDLSTSLRRLLVSHQVTSQLFNWKLFRKYNRNQIQKFRLQLGAMRDIQEMSLKVQALQPASNATQTFVNQLAKQETTAQPALSAAIKDFDRSSVLSLSQLNSEQSYFQSAPVSLIKMFLIKHLKKVAALYQSAVTERNDEAIHQMRVRYKRLRYSLELLAPVLANVPHEKLLYLRTFQQVMGEAHDWLIIDKAIKEFALNTNQTELGQLLPTIEELRFDAHQKAREYLTAEWDNLQLLISSITFK